MTDFKHKPGVIGALHFNGCETCQRFEPRNERSACGFVNETTCAPDLRAEGTEVHCCEYLQPNQ